MHIPVSTWHTVQYRITTPGLFLDASIIQSAPFKSLFAQGWVVLRADVVQGDRVSQ